MGYNKAVIGSESCALKRTEEVIWSGRRDWQYGRLWVPFMALQWGHIIDNNPREEGSIGLGKHCYLPQQPLAVVEHVPHLLHDGPQVRLDPGGQLEPQGRDEP